VLRLRHHLVVVALTTVHDGVIDYWFDLVFEAIPKALRYLRLQSDITFNELGCFVKAIKLILKVQAGTLSFSLRSELIIFIERGLENGLRLRQL
jgi:hypothetical protein